MSAEILVFGKVLDLVIVGLDYLAARNVRITELTAEINAARSEGRPPNIDKFKAEAEAAQAAAHARLDASV